MYSSEHKSPLSAFCFSLSTLFSFSNLYFIRLSHSLSLKVLLYLSHRGSGELKLFGRFNVQHSRNTLHMVNDDLVLQQQILMHILHHNCIGQEASLYRGFAMGHDLPEVAPLCFGGQLLTVEFIQSVIQWLSLLKLVITLDELHQDSIKGSLMYGARFHEDLKNSEFILCS